MHVQRCCFAYSTYCGFFDGLLVVVAVVASSTPNSLSRAIPNAVGFVSSIRSSAFLSPMALLQTILNAG